jgi:CDP-diacylglycerol--serine O-phosphatidyltransferase
MFDGTIAKAMRATSDFGGQMDSLCDAVTFGMLPALLIATGAGRTPLAMAAGLVYLAAVLVRLARFNSENTHDPQAHLYFKGLPSPAGAMTISAWSLAQTAWQGHPEWSGALFAALPGMAAQLPSPLVPAAFVLASMMVGTRRYADLPKHYFRGLKPWWQLVPILLATVLVPWPLGLVVLTTAYVLGGALAAPSRPASAGEVAS